MNKDATPGGKIYADDLTWREQEVLLLLADRLTNREIADQLHLAESTIKDYVGRIISKLYVKNRRQAVTRAKDLGLFDRGRKAAPPPKTNLPAERTPFVGRKQEIQEIQRLLETTRLLTLIGPGGIGKTRLAIKAAEGIAGDFSNGVFFISLTPIQTVKDINQTIAEGLKIPLATHDDLQKQLLRYLRDKQTLLVIDNFEHLLDGVGIVSEILRSAPAIKILATSRERLNLQIETILHVDGMTFPNRVDGMDIMTYDAAILFLQAAGRVRPGFDPSPEELEQIGDICQVVGGMPLAIELAAAWLHILNLDDITNELEKDLDLLATEVRDAPVRHRSIRAVFDHSWSMLDITEQEIFRRLSVFRGGFTRDAVEHVTGASIHILSGLVNKSFLHHDPTSGRFEIHELLRQYAREQLEASTNDFTIAKNLHAAYYADFMQEKWAHLKDTRQMQAIAEIEADIENIRSAWRHYLHLQDIPSLWKFIYGLWHLYWIRWWNQPGLALFTEAVDSLHDTDDHEHTAFKALAMAFQSWFMGWLGLSERAYELSSQSVNILEKLDYPLALVLAYHSLSLSAYWVYKFEEEAEAINKMVALAETLDDRWHLAFVLFAKGMIEIIQKRYSDATRTAEWNLELYREAGDVIMSSMTLIVLGHAAYAQGELETSRDSYLRCLEIAEESGFHYSRQTATKYLCKSAISLGKTEEAEKYLVQCLRITNETGFIRDIVNLLYEYARLLVIQGSLEQAVELLVLAAQHPASWMYRMLEGRIRDSANELLAELEAKLPAGIYKAAVDRGHQLDIDVVVSDLISRKGRNKLG